MRSVGSSACFLRVAFSWSITIGAHFSFFGHDLLYLLCFGSLGRSPAGPVDKQGPALNQISFAQKKKVVFKNSTSGRLLCRDLTDVRASSCITTLVTHFNFCFRVCPPQHGVRHLGYALHVVHLLRDRHKQWPVERIHDISCTALLRSCQFCAMCLNLGCSTCDRCTPCLFRPHLVRTNCSQAEAQLCSCNHCTIFATCPKCNHAIQLRSLCIDMCPKHMCVLFATCVETNV